MTPSQADSIAATVGSLPAATVGSLPDLITLDTIDHFHLADYGEAC